MKNKKNYILFIICGLFLSMLSTFDISHAEDIENLGPEITDYFTVIEDDGNVRFINYDEEVPNTLSSNDYVVTQTKNGEVVSSNTYDTYEEASSMINSKNKMRTFSFRTTSLLTNDISTIADVQNITYGVARIIGYVHYTEYDGTDNGRAGYTHGSYGNDAAFICAVDEGRKIRVKQSGVYMDIPVDNVEVTEYSPESKVSYYYGENGIFRHYYYHGNYGEESKLNSTQVGYTPDYLKDGVKYYSYDGHYFYEDYPTMIKDYQSGVFVNTNAVNASKPFYNYYQYLSFRSTTEFTADDLNGLITNAIEMYPTVDESSKLNGQGQAILNNQSENGTNASLMLGVAINESGWGMSFYAKDRNNLFGIGAVDSNPDLAYSFDTVEDCFKYFSYNTISSGYLNAMNWRYRGPHLGDKLSGFNVKYSSDPYWGEKAASFSYQLNAMTSNKDYQKYQLAICQNGSLTFYQDEGFNHAIYNSTVADSNNKYVYQFPITILDTQAYSYSILSDTVLNDERTKMNATGKFVLNRDYVYLKSSEVSLVNIPQFLKGDVNGDEKVSSLDYIQIKNHIMKSKVLNGISLIRADVNGDGKVSSLDYIKIKNHIMGTNPLF